MNKKIIVSFLVLLFTTCFLLSAGAEGVNWRQFEGQTINLLMNKHTYTNSITDYIDKFTEVTGIKVNLYALPEQQFFEKQRMVLTTGSDEYDISMMGPEFIWEYEPFLEPLDQFIENPNLTDPAWNRGDFFEGLMESNSVGGKLFAVPVMAEGYIFHYRKDLFDKYGLTVPTTLDEWIETTKKLQTALDNDGKADMDALAVRGIRGPGTVILVPTCLLFAAGGTDFDENGKCAINSEISIEIHKKYIELVKAGCSNDWSNYDWYDVKDALTAGRAASGADCNFFAAEQWDPEVSKVVGNMAYALIPSVEVSNTWTWGLSINDASHNKEAAWLFIMWATTQERLLDASLNYNNFDPTRASVSEHPEVKAMFEKMGNYYEVDQQMLSKAKLLPSQFAEVFTFADMWVVALQEMWMGTKTVEDALNDLAKQADAAGFTFLGQ
ncbi:MAG: extracellular solute-binding protein [Candidatus Atribacteria bacterium]|nr:extracellular solute-binding protein [Candidatus Atribacteria bacterium]